MTFAEADAKVAEIAAGKCRALSFQMTTLSSGNVETDCGVYVSGHGWHSGGTWEEALHKLLGTHEQPPEVSA
jgi:hypothetical protein